MAQPLQRVELALDRDHYFLRGDERVHGEQAQRRGTVDKDEVELLRHRVNCSREPGLAGDHRRQLDLRPGEVDCGRRAEQPGQLGDGDGDLVQSASGDEDVVDGGRARAVLHGEGRRGVALGVKVNHQHLGAVLRERCSEVDGAGRLADSALLVRYPDNAPYGGPRPGGVVCFT